MTPLWDKDLPPEDSLPPLTALPTSGGEGHTIPFAALVRIDSDNLRREFEIQASWSHFLGTHYGFAKIRSEQAARALKTLEASLFLEYKQKAKEQKATLDQINSSVTSDPRVQTAYDTLIENKKVEAQWESAKWAWNDRRDMLVQLGAEERAEKRAFGSG